MQPRRRTRRPRREEEEEEEREEFEEEEEEERVAPYPSKVGKKEEEMPEWMKAAISRVGEGEKTCLNNDCTRYKLEKCYVPEHELDEGLRRAGMKVCAVTNVEVKDGTKEVHNQIVFRGKGGREAQIGCIHTAVCQFLRNEDTETGFETVSTEHFPMLSKQISPEDHFWSLKSFVEELCERSFVDSLTSAYHELFTTGREPLDLNKDFRNQMTQALIQVAPEATAKLAIFLLQLAADTPQRFGMMSDEFREVICHHFGEEELRELDRVSQTVGGFNTLGGNIKQCLAANPKLPADIQMKLYKDTSIQVRADLAKNPNLDTEVAMLLVDDKDVNVRQTLGLNPNLKPNVVRLLIDRNEQEVLVGLARRTEQLPREIVNKLLDSEFSAVRRVAVERADVPIEALPDLAQDADANVRKTLAQNKMLVGSPEAFNALMKDESEEVRLTFAGRNDLNDRSLKYMAENEKSEKIRLTLAGKDIEMPSEALERLGLEEFESNESVREAVANRKNLPDPLLVAIVKDSSPKVRKSLASRQMPEDELHNQILENLAADDDKYVKMALLERQKLPTDAMAILATDDLTEIREELAYRNDLPTEVKSKMAGDEAQFVRMLIGRKKDLPMQFIRELAKSPFVDLRYEVAFRDDIPDDLIRELANDPITTVKNAIAERKDLPNAVIEQLIQPTVDSGVRARLAENVRLTDEQIRILAAATETNVKQNLANKQEFLPTDVVVRLANDQTSDVRQAVANYLHRHPNATPNVPNEIRTRLHNEFAI